MKIFLVVIVLLISGCKYEEGSIYFLKQEWFCADKGGVYKYSIGNSDFHRGWCSNGLMYSHKDYHDVLKPSPIKNPNGKQCK